MRFVGSFSRIHRVLGGGMLVRAPTSQGQGPHHHEPRYSSFPYFCMTCYIEILGLADQYLLECDLSALLLRTLAVGRRQQSDSIEVVLDME